MVKEFVTERLKLIDLYPDKAKSVAKEYGLKENEVELIRKGRVSDQSQIDREARTVVNYISTDAIDRDNEVIEHKGVVLDDYKQNPIVPWAHSYSTLPIGKNLWIKSDKKGLVAKTYFLKHPFAQDVFDLYTEDIAKTGPALKAWSVGFIPLKWKEGKPDEKIAENERPQSVRRTYKKWLLLEYSAVPVPSNPEALTLMVEKGLIKNDKLKKDIEDFITEIDKTQYECSCIECGWKHTSDKHCNVYKCEKCGGTMRRAERPGPGQESTEEESSKEVILKPEETDDSIRIPVRDCKVTATITISAGQGITALYCGKIKKIRTYIFSKKDPYSWTMKRALAWVKKHGKSVDAAVEAFTIDLPEENIGNITDTIESYLEEEPKEEEPKEPKTEDPIKQIKELTEENREIRNDNRELRSEIRELKKELKEGRVLSAKTRKAVQTALEGMGIATPPLTSLLTENEPPKEESILPLIDDNSKENDTNSDIKNLTKDDIPVVVEEVIKGIVSNQYKEIQKIFDKKRGKID